MVVLRLIAVIIVVVVVEIVLKTVPPCLRHISPLFVAACLARYNLGGLMRDAGLG